MIPTSASMDPAHEPAAPGNALLANVGLLLLALVAVGVAAAFFVPWFTWSEPGGAQLARYAPLIDGGARLVVDFDAAGTATAWTSQNDIVLPPGLALAAETRKAEREAINKFFRREDEASELTNEVLISRMVGSQIYHSRSRRLTPDGKSTDSVLLAIRDNDGDHLVAFYDPPTDTQTIFDPPVPVLAANFTVGHTWTGIGKRVGPKGEIDYRYTGHVVEQARWKTDAGTFEDTVKIETHLVFIAGTETLFDSLTNYWLAADLGSVESQTLDASGAVTSRTVMQGARDQPLQATSVLPAAARRAQKEPAASDPAKWDLSRFASTRSANDNSESSISPTWIATEPPIVLAARYGGGLIAFNADEPGTPALWQFATGGTVYGQPAFDAERSRIYFGAADKHLYALDTRGLFLWSFATGDNIVTRPLVAGRVVIFGSEDRHIYCLNADTGAELWREELGGAVVSSPVLAGDLAIFGCDDGGVYAFEIATGKQKWRFDAEGPVEAPLVFADDRIFAGTHGGDLYAIDRAKGEEMWSAHVGSELRSAPVIAAGKAYIVNNSGRLSAYDIADGRRIWASDEQDYTGPPVVTGETLIVATQNGDVHAVDLAGHRRQSWPAASVSAPSDGMTDARLGVAEGGGAIWIADAKSVIRRLGPPSDGPVALRASWLLPFSKEPLTKHFLTVAPVAYHSQALVVDGDRDIFLLDPATGKGTRVGTFGETLSATLEPTVAGDTLLSPLATKLYATQLPTGAPRWVFEAAKETSAQPVTAAGEAAFWLTQQFPEAVNGKPSLPIGTLHSLDLYSGVVRWEQPLNGFTGIGGASVAGSIVFTSAPAAAFDLATGAPLWQAQLTDSTLGGGTLNEAGDTLFVGTISHATADAGMAALRGEDGSVVWQKSIGTSSLHPLERPWLSGDVLVVPLWSGEIIGLAAADGSELWRHKPNKPRYGGISVAGRRVWYTENNAHVLALDASTGRVVAQLGLDIDIGNIQAFAPRPLLIGDRVVVPLAIALLGVKEPGAAAEAKQP